MTALNGSQRFALDAQLTIAARALERWHAAMATMATHYDDTTMLLEGTLGSPAGATLWASTGKAAQLAIVDARKAELDVAITALIAIRTALAA